ncbi:putative UPF0481 protein At3g02645 [Salvia hispanica]|uniref:putative UPF0481 protein At3g02645 n=1 Tax=Salvia hispanica TaxID=49212 RepID=UPI0020093F2B|nr:putative UPF0481 protein At3g02645 [Salvia hispanica]
MNAWECLLCCPCIVICICWRIRFPLILPQHYHSLLCQYLSIAFYGDYNMTQLPWTEEEEPLHLLEALRRTSLRLVQTQQNSTLFWQLIKKYNQSSKKLTPPFRSVTDLIANVASVLPVFDSPFRSVTDLIAKGIHLRKSSHCLTDISFFSYGLFAQLHLPFFFVSDESKVFFSNLIAFEMSPVTATDYGVTSYFNFMKTLINNAKDVKVLREKGILISALASDEQMRINEHCKTWMADLFNTNFQSPWTVMALLAATFLLCLTFLQTYYTINPRN